MGGSKHNYYCFTLNNYVEDELVRLRTQFTSEEVRYALFGYEIAPTTGTPHLQGYVAFKTRKSFSFVKAFLPERTHFKACRGSEAKNREYCSKDGKIEEFGTYDVNAGKRNDLESFKEAVKSGVRDMKRLREDFSNICSKYPRFVDSYIRDNIPEPPLKPHPLNDWQTKVNEVLKKPANDREVIFIVDKVGNKGKSWFAKYYCSLHSDAFIMRPTKHADMAYALPNELRVLFLDCTRQQVEFMPYTFMEELKDGLVFSCKYESCVKKYNDMHVVVLMNQEPDMTKLSEDRYNIIYLE